VVGAVLFLLSDLAAHTTGRVVHADGGMHAVAGGIGEPAPTSRRAARALGSVNEC
jgi:enoyl ACP reductase